MKLVALPRLLLCGLSLAGASISQSAELVTLSSGFQMQAESYERVGLIVRLKNNSGTIELPAADVVSVEYQQESPDNPPPPIFAKPQKVTEKTVPEMIAEAGTAQGLPEEFVLSVAKIESGFQKEAVSAKGARGVMQLMPTTASALGVDAESPAQNALGGAKYLRQLLLLYRGDARLALAAYNAGPAAVKRFQGVPPYRETRAYIDKVLREYHRRKAATGLAR